MLNIFLSDMRVKNVLKFLWLCLWIKFMLLLLLLLGHLGNEYRLMKTIRSFSMRALYWQPHILHASKWMDTVCAEMICRESWGRRIFAVLNLWWSFNGHYMHACTVYILPHTDPRELIYSMKKSSFQPFTSLIKYFSSVLCKPFSRGYKLCLFLQTLHI